MADWTREEVEAAVTDYFEMLVLEINGVPFNKAARNRDLQKVVHRDRGAIERKHQNISAVLMELGCPLYIDGYKPSPHRQNLLYDVVRERIESDAGLRELFAISVEKPANPVAPIGGLLSMLIPVPMPKPSRGTKGGYALPRERGGSSMRVNYLEREQRNSSLGTAGEVLVMKFEHERLWKAGEKSLADKVEHVAATKGDHLGYDIHSFEETGEDRLIEVKTTRSGSLTPFFVSRNEVRVSAERRNEYHLYRMHRIETDPKFFVLKGQLDEVCVLDPVEYQARVRAG